ncbi:uncharacterized protein K02A2.6-like [Gopherus flavomarginatus]|uniref:uncharacterized protein K02A2.6-like n=1 Tax=Gopherus flavomarginatus TaxID=286002 RepID=UPI0021CB9EBE|nr:uncharacterized protein K02A2.6-like [Gopherus flavomarginatus]
MELDTSTALSLVLETVYKEKLQHLPLKATKTVLKTYTGEAVPMLGTTDVKVELNGQAAKLPLFVVRGNYPALMGRSWLRKIQLNWAEVHQVTKEETGLTTILRKHAAVFGEDLGSMKGITVTLNVKPDSPPKYLKARTVPYAIRPKVKADLELLVTNGVLIPVTHSPWATPIVPIVKKDGSLRISGDFKDTVNPVLCAEQYPLPRINDLFAGLAGGQKFSKIDLSQAHLQMHIDEKSQELLTIVTHKGLYRYCHLPFRITSAPTLFQRAMDQILCGLPGVQCYLDDILVTGRNEEDHLRNLEATLQRLEEYGLRVRKDKCEFFQPSVEYLGHITDATGLRKAPAKAKAIVEALPPGNVSQLHSFLGLLNYYGKFISQLATLL